MSALAAAVDGVSRNKIGAVDPSCLGGKEKEKRARKEGGGKRIRGGKIEKKVEGKWRGRRRFERVSWK